MALKMAELSSYSFMVSVMMAAQLIMDVLLILAVEEVSSYQFMDFLLFWLSISNVCFGSIVCSGG